MPNSHNNDIYSAYKQFEFDELNVLYSKLLESVNNEMNINTQEVIEECEDFLIAMYFSGLMSIEQKTGKSVERPKNEEVINIVYQEVDGKTFEDRIIEASKMAFPHSAERLETIFVSDGHRCFVNGQFYSAKQTGGIKIWDATMDRKTRITHAELNNTALGLDEYFETPNGRALAPSMFGVPEEDINCRCILDIIL